MPRECRSRSCREIATQRLHCTGCPAIYCFCYRCTERFEICACGHQVSPNVSNITSNDSDGEHVDLYEERMSAWSARTPSVADDTDGGSDSTRPGAPEERRVHPCDTTQQPYSYLEFIEYAVRCGMPGSYGHQLWQEAVASNLDVERHIALRHNHTNMKIMKACCGRHTLTQSILHHLTFTFADSSSNPWFSRKLVFKLVLRMPHLVLYVDGLKIKIDSYCLGGPIVFMTNAVFDWLRSIALPCKFRKRLDE